MKKSGTLFGALAVGFCCLSAWGTLPDSRYQYAAGVEYDDLLVLPWVSREVDDPSMVFQCPKCMENQKVSDRYAEAMRFSGVVKLAAGNVMACFILGSYGCTDAAKAEVEKLMAASESELASPLFVKSIASLAGKKEIVETGAAKVGGRKAFWCTIRMERRVGNQVVYRGLQRMYFVPLENGKKVVMTGYAVGVLGVDEIPYADFKAFQPIGEKIVESLKIDERKRKLW